MAAVWTYYRPSECHARSRITLTCNEANISISSSVQSISSSRMDQRACSYSWVILTASYWNTGTDTTLRFNSNQTLPWCCFQGATGEKKKKDTSEGLSLFWVSYFRIDVKEDIVLEAQQQLVFLLDVLLHEGMRRVQPPVNQSNNRSDELWVEISSEWYNTVS